MNRRATLATAALVATVTGVVTAPPALAGDDGVVRRGGCSRAADWKLKAGPDDGRIEVEGEVDSNRSGQVWRWRLVHDGSVSARGRATTSPPSGSFEVRRVLVDLAGTDHIVFRAKNRRSGEICRGTVRF
jgi:hypothetical protein